MPWSRSRRVEEMTSSRPSHARGLWFVRSVLNQLHSPD
jgi:hypothetical protein